MGATAERPREEETRDARSPGRARTSLLAAGLTQAVVALAVGFAWLDATDVVRMEGIVAEGARDFAERDAWLVPRVHGAVYTYKPPLAYWLARLSFALFGESELSLRAPFAACAVLLASAVFLCVARLSRPWTACLAAVATCTGFLFVQKARTAEFDLPLAAGLGLACAGACTALVLPRPRAAAWLVVGLGLAIGLLAKGPIAAAIFLPGLLLAALAVGRGKRLWRPAPLFGLALAAALGAGWLLAAIDAAGPVVLEQPRAEAGVRGLGWDLAGVLRTPLKPLAASGLFFPWSPLVLCAASRRFRAGLPERERLLLRAALGFLLGGLLALMAVPTYEPRYLLPLATPVGIAAALVVARWELLPPRTGRSAVTAARALALLVGGTLAIGAPFGLPFEPPGAWLAVPLGVCLVVAALRGARPVALLLGLAAAGWLVHARWLEPRQASSRTLRATGEAFARRVPPGAPVWTPFKDEHSSLFFYLDRPVRAAGPELERAPAGAWLVLAPRREELDAVRADPGLSIELEREQHARRFLLARKR